MNNENQPNNASLSTMWAIKNYPDLNDFFSITKELGFQAIELNHQINSEMLSRVNLDRYRFSSIHEPCPSEIANKVLINRDWVISSTDEASRNEGVAAVKKSIVLAHELGAPIVVLHCGNVTIDMSYEFKLRQLFNSGKLLTDEYRYTQSQFIQMRCDLVGPRFQAVKKSLGELLEFADLFNVRLGLENRYHYTDIPIIDEMEELLSLGNSDKLGFIYDVGHAQALDRLGFFAHLDWLNRFAPRIFGSHLHDVIGLSDHYAPGLGEIDFYSIANYLPENSFRTFELQPGNTLAQIKRGINLLANAGCIKYLSLPKEF
jgi:sugar phosphate isomerase/epimerase